MQNVNAIMDEIKENEQLSRAWRVASSGASYAPMEGELWHVDPSIPFGSPLGGQTAVKGTVSGIERPFWPSWLVKTYPVPQGKGSSKVVLRGHLLNGKEVSSLPLEDLLQILSTKDIKVSSVEATIGLKRKYENGSCVGLSEEIIKLYSWETVERSTSSEETPTEE